MTDKAKNSRGINAKFYWDGEKDSKEPRWRLVTIHLFESLGGAPAGGEIELWHVGDNKSLSDVTEKSKATLILTDEKDGGLKFEIPLFVITRSFYGNVLNIKVACISDKSFGLKRKSTVYPDIKTAISSTYPGKKNILIEPGVSPDGPVRQSEETDQAFNTRMCLSYKKDCIFGYGFEGLILKDRQGDKDHNGENEAGDPKIKVNAGKLANPVTPSEMKDVRNINREVINPWTDSDHPDNITKKDYSEFSSKNFNVLMKAGTHALVHKDQESHSKNALVNSSFLEYGGFHEIVIVLNDMPNYKLGDAVQFIPPSADKEKDPINKFVVGSNEIFYALDGSNKTDFSGAKFSWTTKLYGLVPGDWIGDDEKDKK